MSTHGPSRADLLRILESGGDVQEAAALLGFLESSPVDVEVGSSEVIEGAGAGSFPLVTGGGAGSANGAQEEGPGSFADVPFWRAIRYRGVDKVTETPDQSTAELTPDEVAGRGPHRSLAPPPTREEVPWTIQRPRLLKALGQPTATNRIDVPMLIDQAVRLRSFDRFPVELARRPFGRIDILVDCSTHLTPLFADQVALVGRIISDRWFAQVRVLTNAEGPSRPWRDMATGASVAADVLDARTVLVLGDLGVGSGPRASAPWERIGEAFAARRARPVVLFPLEQGRASGALRRLYRIIPWDPGMPHGLDPALHEQNLDALARWVSVSERVSPGLLRAVRRWLDLPGASIATEIDLWADRTRARASDVALTVDGQMLDEFAEHLDGADPASLAEWFATLREWHMHLPPELWNMAVLHMARVLPGEGGAVLASAVGEARDWASRWCRTTFRSVADARATERFLHHLEERSPGTIGAHRELAALSYRARPNGGSGPSYGAFDLQELRSLLGNSEITESAPLTVMQTLTGIEGSGVASEEGPSVGESPVFFVDSCIQPVRIQSSSSGRFLDLTRGSCWLGPVGPQIVDTGTGVTELEVTCLEPWMESIGRDSFGLWAEIELAGACHRMRWVPPGEFWMGSPEGEPGREGSEGPLHRVRLSEGFWLGETPCTQDLWESVMGENPSRWKDPKRPVEKISWNRVQRFLARSEELLPGIGLGLPTEAQWEYACRAGGSDLLYQGGWAIEGKRTATALDALGWYGGNSGVGYERDDGFDASSWLEKQHSFGKAGTRQARKKRPNAWGLYDMLGNVWEWCQDGKRSYKSPDEADPSGSLEPGSKRAVRGGSWNVDARYVRPAERDAFPPGGAHSDLGFRLSRSHGSGSTGESGRADGRY